MAMDTSWATEIRWQDTGITDAADPLVADLGTARRRAGFPPPSSMTCEILWAQFTQAPKC
jgi:hypothetical protein